LKVRAFIDFAVPRLTDRLQTIAATLDGRTSSSSGKVLMRATRGKVRKPR
jgi:hypothetical protein